MSLRDMFVFAGVQRVNLNLFAACICYTVASSSVETPSRRLMFAGNFFSDLLPIQAHRLNHILIIGHLRDTDIRQCLNNRTYLIYCVNSHIG